MGLARRIGKVEVDHGETVCETPDAESPILKIVPHRKSVCGRSYRQRRFSINRSNIELGIASQIRRIRPYASMSRTDA